MIACPECGVDLPDDANFCRNCGSALTPTCPNCGESVEAGASFCPNCGENFADGGPDRAVSSGEGPLRLRPNEFARRVSGDDLQAPGLLNRLRQKKQVTIEAGHRALLLEDGELRETIGPGKHSFDSLGTGLTGLLSSSDLRAILVADGERVVRFPVENVRTASEYLVDVEVELVVGVDEPDLFFTSMMADREAVTSDTFRQLLGDAISDELEAAIQEYDTDDLYGNRELKQDLRQAIERHCRSTLERNGLSLVDVQSFDYADDRDEIREGQKAVEIREEAEDLEDERARLDRRQAERGTEDAVHEEKQRVRRESAEQTADHELDKQDVQQDQELDDIERRHSHTAEREDVEHEQETARIETEGEVERRDVQHEQDMKELDDLLDIKKKKDKQKLDRKAREQDIEMQKEEHEVEIEKERLDARDEVEAQTLASLDETDEDMADLAKMDKATELDPDKLDSLGAQKSDELAKARQEANKAETERQRVEDQKEFREEVKEMAEGSMDRMQETTESAMDNMGETGRAAAEDTSDNVIVSGSDGGGGDTTVVQGGSGGDSSDEGSEKVVICPNCENEVPHGDAFCMNCGTEL